MLIFRFCVELRTPWVISHPRSLQLLWERMVCQNHYNIWLRFVFISNCVLLRFWVVYVSVKPISGICSYSSGLLSLSKIKDSNIQSLRYWQAYTLPGNGLYTWCYSYIGVIIWPSIRTNEFAGVVEHCDGLLNFGGHAIVRKHSSIFMNFEDLKMIFNDVSKEESDVLHNANLRFP